MLRPAKRKVNKMKKNEIFSFIAISLAVLVPVPGRFACGLILVIALNLFMFIGTIFRKIIYDVHLEDLQPVLIAIFLIFMGVIFKQLLILYSPILALTLGFVIYMEAISSFIVGSLYEVSNNTMGQDIKINMTRSLKFSLIALIFFLLRDILGYGTITLPKTTGYITLNLFANAKFFVPSVFLASIPGALVLVAVFLVIFVRINRKLAIAKNLVEEVQK